MGLFGRKKKEKQDELVLPGLKVSPLIPGLSNEFYAQKDQKKNRIEQSTDQVELAGFARDNNEPSDVRIAAIAKLTDQSVIADLAKNGDMAWVRAQAVYRLNDVDLLTQIAKNDSDSRVRKGATARLEKL